MKSLLAKLGVFVLFVGLFIFADTQGWGADWKYFAGTDQGAFFYDLDSVTRPSKDIVRVSMRTPFSEEYVSIMVNTLGEKYKTLSYGMNLVEYHCKDKKYRILSSAFYSVDGKTISSENSPSAEWIFINQETEKKNEILCTILCK